MQLNVQTTPPAGPQTNGIEPYVGPRSFRKEQRAFFFGRDEEADDLVSIITAHAAVLLYSQSGAGKTSLLNAKLIPKLEEEEYFHVLPSMRVASMVEHVDTDLYSGYVVARDLAPATAADGLRSVSAQAVPSVSGFTALRNFLYAVEWWIFGGFAVFVWGRWCQDTLHPPEPDEEPEA